jgi:hypothetical protein
VFLRWSIYKQIQILILIYRDTTGLTAKHRAEHYSRSAAAAAHASYYAHPSLHISTYIPRQHRNSDEYNVDAHREGQKVEPMNEAKQATGTKDDLNHDPTAPSAVPPSQQIGEEDKVKRGTDGTIEELGGKKDAGPPSGLDKGALEKGGEAQGTISSPGPTAQEVAQYHSQVNGNAPAEAERPGIEKFWKVSARMEPHLQLMYVSHTTVCAPLISGVVHC